MKTHLKTLLDIPSSFLQKEIDDEFDTFFDLYTNEFINNYAPNSYFLLHGKNTTDLPLLLATYKKEIETFNEDFYGVLFMHFKTRKWSAISFILNKDYNFHFNMNLVDYQQSIYELNQSCIEALMNLHVQAFNKSNRLKI